MDSSHRSVKNYPISSVPVHFDISSEKNVFLVIDITKNRYFNVEMFDYSLKIFLPI